MPKKPSGSERCCETGCRKRRDGRSPRCLHHKREATRARQKRAKQRQYTAQRLQRGLPPIGHCHDCGGLTGHKDGRVKLCPACRSWNTWVSNSANERQRVIDHHARMGYPPPGTCWSCGEADSVPNWRKRHCDECRPSLGARQNRELRQINPRREKLRQLVMLSIKELQGIYDDGAMTLQEIRRVNAIGRILADARITTKEELESQRERDRRHRERKAA